jgi:hypothetical protein
LQLDASLSTPPQMAARDRPSAGQRRGRGADGALPFDHAISVSISPSPGST